MCDTERHQLTNEMRQTGFRAGFFPGLIGINCERLQSTTRRLTFASSERFLLIVLMITSGAGDHHGAGARGGGGKRLPGAWLPGYLLQEGCATCQALGHGTEPQCGPVWLLTPMALPVYNATKETLGNPNRTLVWLWLKALSSSWTRMDPQWLVQVSSCVTLTRSLLSSGLGSSLLLEELRIHAE